MLALAVQRWPRKKKKKVARNFLKFCMEVYNLILSTSGKDLEKIPTNEVFTCTFSPWPCNVGLGKKKKKVARNFLKFCMEVYNLILRTSGKDLEKIPTNEVFMRWCLGVGKPRAHFGLGRATLASEKKKKKVARNF